MKFFQPGGMKSRKQASTRGLHFTLLFPSGERFIAIQRPGNACNFRTFSCFNQCKRFDRDFVIGPIFVVNEFRKKCFDSDIISDDFSTRNTGIGPARRSL